MNECLLTTLKNTVENDKIMNMNELIIKPSTSHQLTFISFELFQMYGHENEAFSIQVNGEYDNIEIEDGIVDGGTINSVLSSTRNVQRISIRIFF